MSKNRILYALGTMSLLLMLALITPFLLPDLDDIGNTTDLTPVPLTIGDHHFNIPKAYLWYKPNWTGQVDQAIHMVATLPDLAPYSEETKIFYKGGPGLKYKVSFDILNTTAPLQTAFGEERLTSCLKNWQDFKVCPHPQQPQRLEVLIHQAHKLTFICPKIGTQRSPMCSTTLSIRPGLTLKIEMHEKHLPEANQIIKDVTTKVQGFLSK